MRLSSDFSFDEAVASCQDIIEPKFLKLTMPNGNAVQKALPELLQTNWSKLFEDIDKNEAILTTLFQSMFLGTQSLELYELRSLAIQSDVTMVFGSFAKKSNHNKFVKLLRKILPGYVILEINGDETTNRKAEDDTKKAVAQARKDGKRVVIVSKDMASRSYSISEIDTVLLAYDRGSLATTMQKIPRAFTPGDTYIGQAKTDAQVITLSFDANRQEMDPVDQFIMAEASRTQDMSDEESFRETLRQVAMCYNIFQNDAFMGPISIDIDTYVDRLIDVSNLESICASIAVNNIGQFADMFIDAVIEERHVTTSSDPRLVNVDISDVKKYAPTEKESKDPVEEDTDAETRRQFLKNIEFFVKNLDQLIALDGYVNTNITDIISGCVADIDLATEFEELFGLRVGIVKEIVDRKILPNHLINMTIQKML
jgi:hypothetical protein